MCRTFYQLDGITPAYAGKSVFADFPGQLFKDHPRVCGEKILMFMSDEP